MMNHYFYNGRQVGDYYAGWGTRDNSCCESNYSNAATSIFCTNDAKSVYALFTTSDANCTLRCTSSWFIFHSIWRDIFMKESDSIESLFIFRLASFQGRRRGYQLCK